MRKLLKNSAERIKRISYLKGSILSERIARSSPFNAGWMYYDSTLNTVNSVFKMKLQDQIKRHMGKRGVKEYHILDIGCGKGTTISELEQVLSKNGLRATYTATSIQKNPKWSELPNHNKINWVKTEAENITDKIKPNSIDFIYSNMGVRYAQDIRNALVEIHKLLKKGGRVVFSHRGRINSISPNLVPPGFKAVRKSVIHASENPQYEEAVNETVVFYLEKI